jgi:glycosyltransferase involved in cell wall biosynthesis
MGRSRVGIVIPALNESATIAGVVKVASNYGTPIVVDDGSVDDTAILAVQAGAVVVSHKVNLGYDAALNSGFNRAYDLDCEILITLDADGQHDPLLAQKLIDGIENGADVVVGNRGCYQRVAEYLFACYTKWRFGIYDPLCGMKAYRRKVYEDLGYFDSYGSIGTQLMLHAAKNRCRIEQIKFQVRERQDSPRFGRIILGNYKILRSLMLSMLHSN